MSEIHQETAAETSPIILSDVKNSRPPAQRTTYTLFNTIWKKTPLTKDVSLLSKPVADARPTDIKKSRVSDYPELLREDRDNIEFRLGYLPDRAQKRDKLSQALLTGNWQDSIFDDGSFPYYAADGLIEIWQKEATVTNIQELQLATVTHYYHYKAYAKTVTPLCLLNPEKTDFSEAGKKLIKCAQAMYPQQVDFPIPYFDKTMAQEFLKKLQQLPASEQYAFVFTHHQDLPFFDISPGETSFIFKILDKEITGAEFGISTVSEEVAVLTCGAFVAFNAAMRGKNMALLQPYLGMATREYVEFCKRGNSCVISIFLPHTTFPKFLHDKENHPIVSTAHDLRHFFIMVSIELEIREFAWFFLDELRTLLADKTHAYEPASDGVEQGQNSLFWTKETWAVPDFTPDIPTIIFSNFRGSKTLPLKAAWKTLTAGEKNLILSFEVLSSLLANPDSTRVGTYANFLTYFYLTFCESEKFKAMGFAKVTPLLELYHPPGFLDWIGSRYQGEKMTAMGFLDFHLAKLYWQEFAGSKDKAQEQLELVLKGIAHHKTAIEFVKKPGYEICLLSDQRLELEPGKLYLSDNRTSRSRRGNIVYHVLQPTADNPKKTVSVVTRESAPSPFTLEELEPFVKDIYKMAIKAGHMNDYANCFCLSINGEMPPLDQPLLLAKDSRLKEIVATYEMEARLSNGILDLSNMKLGDKTFTELEKLINSLPRKGFHTLNLQDNQLHMLGEKGMYNFFQLLAKLPKFRVLNLANNGKYLWWYPSLTSPFSCWHAIRALQALPAWIRVINITRFIDNPAPYGSMSTGRFMNSMSRRLVRLQPSELEYGEVYKIGVPYYEFSYVAGPEFFDFLKAQLSDFQRENLGKTGKVWRLPLNKYEEGEEVWDADYDAEQELLPPVPAQVSEQASSSLYGSGSPAFLAAKEHSSASSSSSSVFARPSSCTR